MADCRSAASSTTTSTSTAARATTVAAVNANAAVSPPAAVAHLFGSFHYIVQEQAKSMVAIQVSSTR